MEICAKRLVTRFELFSLGNYIFRATFDFYFLERSLVYCQKKTISTLNVYSEFYQRKCELAGVRKWPELPKYTLDRLRSRFNISAEMIFAEAQDKTSGKKCLSFIAFKK